MWPRVSRCGLAERTPSLAKPLLLDSIRASSSSARTMSDAVRLALRGLGLILGIAIGWQTGSMFAVSGDESNSGNPALVIALTIGTIGYILGPRLSWALFHNLRDAIKEASIVDLMAIALGLVFGGLVSALVAVPLAMLPGRYGSLLPVIVAAILIALAIFVTVLRKRDLIVPLVRGRLAPRSPSSTEHRAAPQPTVGAQPALLDTSVIIDGRIADLARTGFLNGRLMVARFVLDELQHVADSSDLLRRNRGRRGLDILTRLQHDAVVPVKIADTEIPEAPDVDAKLVKLAKMMQAPILTNDYNLNKVAEIQGVAVLNINELANAVKSVVLPGEELTIRIMQEGKEPGQGVGYLEDGTMVVVEGGRRYLNSQLEVIVTRVLQTVAGRLVFAQPKEGTGQ